MCDRGEEKAKRLRLHHGDIARHSVRICEGYRGFRTRRIGFGIVVSCVGVELWNRLGFVRTYIFLGLLSGDCGPTYRRDLPGDMWGTRPVPLILAGG